MSQQIRCTLRNSPEALERVLRVIRVRGFQLLHLEMRQDLEQMQLYLNVRSERHSDNLVKQLRKLIDIQNLQTDFFETEAEIRT